MKKKLILVASLVFVICCLLAVSVNAAQCADGCTDNWTVTEGTLGCLGDMSAKNTCPTCGTDIAVETIEAMFVTTGYSYNETNGGIVQQFAVNKASVSRYTEITGKAIKYGAIIATGKVLDEIGTSPIDANGKAIDERIFAADVSSTDCVVFDVMVNNIPEDARASAAIVCGTYVILGEKVFYIDDGKANEKAVAHTYDEVVGIVTTPAAKKSLKVLTIGNSFSDDSMEYVYNIAKAAGIEYVELDIVRRSNGSLANHIADFNSTTKNYAYRHWADGATGWDHNWDANSTLKAVLEKRTEWDYVVFHQVSTQSGDASTYDDLNTLMELVRPYCPNAKFAWLMTWAYRADYASSGPSYAKIVSAVNEKIVTNENIDVIIPCGTAIENARESGQFTAKQLHRNSNHLGYGMGRYIASLTFFKALTGLDIDDMNYPTKDTEGNTQASGNESFQFTDRINEICIESANNAIENPFAVTPSQYK